MLRLLLPIPVLISLLAVAVASAQDTVVRVFDGVTLHYQGEDPILYDDASDPNDEDAFVTRHRGQQVDRKVTLPDAPATQAEARRILATIRVEPVYTEVDGGRRPNDPWTRLGHLALIPDPSKGESAPEVELVRFVTGYGGPGTFVQDVTPLAPLLHGERTLRIAISTYALEPSWRITVELRYTTEGVGQRRPRLALPTLQDLHVGSEDSTKKQTVSIPRGCDQPRIRIISTGHATNGEGKHEFISATHVLRVDGQEVARWRPWSEAGGPTRRLNPFSGRRQVGGREIRSSDLDRSGWTPGLIVDPLIIPLPELTPGTHEVELEILNLRPRDGVGETPGAHGYFAVSAMIVADEPWPGD